MKGDKKSPWIETGYLLFANNGSRALSVESIARTLQKNKSSFYHYFGDIDSFLAHLFQHHLEKANEAGNKISACPKLDPDVLNVLIEHKSDFLFHRQLRMERSNSACKACYEKAYELVENPILEKLTKALGLQNRLLFASTLLNLVVDNFLLRITAETFTLEWLQNYLRELYLLSNQSKEIP